MTRADIDNYAASLSDTELLQRAEQAHADIEEAARKEPNSEWHQSCFAGLYIYCSEMGRRGLKRAVPAPSQPNV